MSSFLNSISTHCWNKDRSLVAIAPNSNDIFIYSVKGEDCTKWKKIHTLVGHFMTVTGIDWNHKTNMIVSTGQDRNAYVWKLENNEWKPTLVILRIGRAATCVKWSPDGRKFAVGSGSKQIPVCHYEEGNDMWIAKMIKKGPKSTILCVDWSPNSLFIISGGSDFKCRIHSGYIKDVDGSVTVDEPYSTKWGKNCTKFGEVLAEFDQSRGWIEGCSFSPCGTRFAFAGHDSTVHFGTITGSDIKVDSILRRDLPLRDISFLTKDLAIGGGHDMVPIKYEYNNGTWEEKGSIDEGKSNVKKTSNKNKAFNMWQTKSKLGKGGGDDVALPFRHQNVINDVLLMSGTKFSTSSVDGKVLVWDANKKY